MNIWAWTLIIGSSFLFLNCSKNPDEQAIRGVIEDMRVGMEELRYDSVVNAVSEDYSDNVNNTKANLKNRLQRIFGRFERLEVKTNILEVQIKGMTALAKLKMKIDGIEGERKERLFGNPIRAAELHLHFEKRSGRWRIVGSTVVRKRGIF